MPAAFSLADIARLARERMDPAVWDFIEGGAGQERTLAANTEAFVGVEWVPRVLSGVGSPDTRTSILGRDWLLPFGIAPMAYHTLADDEGEIATARAAGAAGVPVVVSTFAGRTFEEIAAAATAPLWLQVYCFRDRSVTRELIGRAERAGFQALVLTVDAPRLGRRLRDLRNGFALPPHVRPGNLDGAGTASPADHALTAFDSSGLDWSVLEWIRSVSTLPLLLKGIMSGSDARRAVDAGADGIIVSNHGGRQLDGVPATLAVLPEIAAAVAGRGPVLLDGGVRSGADILAALALGADAALLGRPIMHGLAVGGQAGVERVLDIVVDELTETMVLTGTRSVADAGPELIRGASSTEWPSEMPSLATGEHAPIARASVSVPSVPASGFTLREEELHSSVSDPLLDTMTFLNEITARYPKAISFAPGRPYDGFFDTEQIVTYLRRYLVHLAETGSTPDEIRDALFQYGPTAGRIRDLIAESLRKDEGIDVAPEAIVVTVGCQEAMFLALRALIAGPDDVLLVSSPCYVGITGAARLLDIGVVPVEEREAGFDVADLEAAVYAERVAGRRPRAFYVVPDHSNPLGTTMSLETRLKLLEAAACLGVLILEDSPYRLVSPGRQLPTLKSLDRRRGVVHLGSFSKSLFPGARVGFAIADQEVVDRAGGTRLLADELAKIKSMVTVNTPALSQAVVGGMLLAAGGGAAELNVETSAHYGEAMRATLHALDRHFPADRREALGIRWNQPTGGFFLTLGVPFVADNAALARSAEDFGVVWTPMSYFHPAGGGARSIRLSTSYVTQAEITEGVARLSRFIEEEASGPHPAPSAWPTTKES